MTFLISHKKVLMVKKGIRIDDPNSGYFTLPGGKLKDGEKGLSPKGRIMAAIRETQEETGIKPLNPTLKGIILFDNEGRIFDNWKNPSDFLVYIYVARKYKGKVRNSEEGVTYGIPLDKIEELPSNPGDARMYEWLKDGRNFTGVIRHKGNMVDEENTWVDYI